MGRGGEGIDTEVQRRQEGDGTTAVLVSGHLFFLLSKSAGPVGWHYRADDDLI